MELISFLCCDFMFWQLNIRDGIDEELEWIVWVLVFKLFFLFTFVDLNLKLLYIKLLSWYFYINIQFSFFVILRVSFSEKIFNQELSNVESFRID